MLAQLLEKYSLTVAQAAAGAGVSPEAVRKWLRGHRPSKRYAPQVAGIFDEADAQALLTEWGYDLAAERRKTTHDPAVANGWRLDDLVRLMGEAVTLLARIDGTLRHEATHTITYTIEGDE